MNGLRLGLEQHPGSWLSSLVLFCTMRYPHDSKAAHPFDAGTGQSPQIQIRLTFLPHKTPGSIFQTGRQYFGVGAKRKSPNRDKLRQRGILITFI